MNATHTSRNPTRQPTAIHVLVHLMERLDRSAEPVGAEQYRAVAVQLAQALEAAPAGPALDLLLEQSPSAAEVYENLQYRYAGLCRSPLDASLQSETAAKDAIEKARHTSGFTNRDSSSVKK